MGSVTSDRQVFSTSGVSVRRGTRFGSRECEQHSQYGFFCLLSELGQVREGSRTEEDAPRWCRRALSFWRDVIAELDGEPMPGACELASAVSLSDHAEVVRAG